jgi:TRAP-type mannitol/chloroaromatic compound transport system substrate-binding protein
VNQFFTTIPFGLTAQEMNAWLYYGGGMDLWREAYEHHGLIPTAAGNTGVQMAGWFNREINDIQDLSGLKMRIPGFGANALTAAKGTVVTLAGGELFSALQSGAIDATEWVGPYNDLAFGLYKIAKYYYYPAWHEPGSTMECMINKKAYESLPKQLQNIVTYASRVANQDMLAEFTAKNGQALHTLVNEHRVDLRPLPFAVLKQMRQYVDEAIRNEAAKDPFTQKVYDSIEQFRQQVSAWHDVSERAYMNMRALINDSKKFDYCTPVVEEARPPTV